MRISDWSSDVCSSDLDHVIDRDQAGDVAVLVDHHRQRLPVFAPDLQQLQRRRRFGHEQGRAQVAEQVLLALVEAVEQRLDLQQAQDRKSTRLNSSTNAHLVRLLLVEKKKHCQTTRTQQQTLT